MHMLKWNLKKLMICADMDYRDLAHNMGYHPNTVSKLVNNMPARLEMRTLAGLCAALNCQPGDLLEYVEDEQECSC
jgi:putative transcriptional regulator